MLILNARRHSERINKETGVRPVSFAIVLGLFFLLLIPYSVFAGDDTDKDDLFQNIIKELRIDSVDGEAGIHYERENFNIGAVFSSTDYADVEQRLKEREIGITAGINFKEGFKIEAEFARVYSEGAELGFMLFEMALTYEF